MADFDFTLLKVHIAELKRCRGNMKLILERFKRNSVRTSDSYHNITDSSTDGSVSATAGNIDLIAPEKEPNAPTNTTQHNTASHQPSISGTNNEAGTNVGDITCLVCFESLFDRTKKVAGCGHIFCASCMDRLIASNMDCPMCIEAF